MKNGKIKCTAIADPSPLLEVGFHNGGGLRGDGNNPSLSTLSVQRDRSGLLESHISNTKVAHLLDSGRRIVEKHEKSMITSTFACRRVRLAQQEM